eukprot:GHVQ01027421.1.p2 GENE.GHVQ01027421.1~~GHVQ01027421.1.p2  ORF type:complete len:309 (+),score=55.63 GHVQ01027421.1:533-1459(+)
MSSTSASSNTKPLFSFGLKKKDPTTSATGSSSSAGSSLSVVKPPSVAFVNTTEPSVPHGENHQSILSISISGGIEAVGGKDTGPPIIPCLNRLTKSRPRQKRKQIEEGEEDESDGILTKPGISKEPRSSVVDEQEAPGSTITEILIKRKERLSTVSGGLIMPQSVKKDDSNVRSGSTETETSEEYQPARSTKSTELESFRKELHRYPEMSMASYDRISVEDFGLAMVRGMGFDPTKEFDAHGNKVVKPYELKKRAYVRAGIGADEKVLLPPERGGMKEEKNCGKEGKGQTSVGHSATTKSCTVVSVID